MKKGKEKGRGRLREWSGSKKRNIWEVERGNRVLEREGME